MCNAIGIVNYEGPNVQVKGMQDYRPVSAFSFLGRYRLVDFPISNLSNSGVNHILPRKIPCHRLPDLKYDKQWNRPYPRIRKKKTSFPC